MTKQDEEIKRLRDTLANLIAWIAQSANSPLSRSEASQLLRKLGETDG
jgi:hypothetical protein